MLKSLPLKSFYFIRHGETIYNKQNIVMGQMDISLNENGIAQAYEVSSYIDDFSIIYSSPLKRASQTAEIINKNFNRPIMLDDRLMERFWGEGQGKLHNVKLSSLNDEEIPLGAEKWLEFESRVINSVTDMLNKNNEKPVIVAHGGVFVVLAKYCNEPSLRSDNCELYLFEPFDGRWFIEKKAAIIL